MPELTSQTYANCIADNSSNCWNGTTCYSEFVPSCYDANTTVTINSYCDTLQWKVDFVGKSGQFKFYPCSNSNFFIKVDLLSLQGYDSKGKKTSEKVTSFSYASAEQGTYSESSLYTYDGSVNSNAQTTTLGGVRLNYSWEIASTQVNMLLYVYLLENDYQLVLRNKTYLLKQSSVKFSYDITNFPVTANNVKTVALSVRLTTGGNTDSGSNGNSSGSFNWGENCQTEGCGSFSFEAPSTATIDGTTDDFTTVTFDTTGDRKSVV